jgi:hypothetical protein
MYTYDFEWKLLIHDYIFLAKDPIRILKPKHSILIHVSWRALVNNRTGERNVLLLHKWEFLNYEANISN